MGACYLVETSLSPLALNVVLLRKRESTKGLHARLARRPGRLGGEVLGRVGLLGAVLLAVVELGRPIYHESCRLCLRIG